MGLNVYTTHCTRQPSPLRGQNLPPLLRTTENNPVCSCSAETHFFKSYLGSPSPPESHSTLSHIPSLTAASSSHFILHHKSPVLLFILSIFFHAALLSLARSVQRHRDVVRSLWICPSPSLLVVVCNAHEAGSSFKSLWISATDKCLTCSCGRLQKDLTILYVFIT